MQEPQRRVVYRNDGGATGQEGAIVKVNDAASPKTPAANDTRTTSETTENQGMKGF